MDEKKLTDEEIVKALECCAVEPCEDCGKCPRFMKEKLCHKANAKQSLDLINRQKAEIERLKKRHGVALLRNDDLDLENYELKKQVDELKAQFLATCENCHLKKDMELLRYQKEQAVKDTAKNALEDFICRLVNARLVGVNDDLYVELLETKDDLLKEKYGVEVE